MNTRIFHSLILAAATFFIFSTNLNAADQSEATSQSIFDFLKANAIGEAQLELNLDTLVANKNSDATIPATFRFKHGKKQTSEISAKVNVRGRYRRRLCELPPLKLRFDKSDLKDMGLNNHAGYKLVTHCTDDLASAEYLLREYIAYELYQSLSPYSLRAHLIKLSYINSATGKKTTNYAIMVEDTDEMAERLNGEVCDNCYGLPTESFDANNLHIHALFQYMIGNTDWSLEMNKNVKLLRLNENGLHVVVPYDFDFSGFVNAPYAVPDSKYSVKSVRERVWLGHNPDPEKWENAKVVFQSKKKELSQKIFRCKGINSEAKLEMSDYIESFYADLSSFFPGSVTVTAP